MDELEKFLVDQKKHVHFLMRTMNLDKIVLAWLSGI